MRNKVCFTWMNKHIPKNLFITSMIMSSLSKAKNGFVVKHVSSI